jgi:DNA polymerase III epsilon subunit-like protein
MKISDATFALIDTETTRKDPVDPENELCEVACDVYDIEEAGVLMSEDHLELRRSFSSLVYVVREIPPENSAVHNLTLRDLIDAPERTVVMEKLRAFIPQDAICVAHNSRFDQAVLADSSLGDFLCTERMARHLVPNAPNFKLSTLRYLFGFYDIDYSELPEERRVHSAAGDLRVLAPVFFHLVSLYRKWAGEVCNGDASRLEKAEQVETLMAWSKAPYKMTYWPNFGKHKGIAFDQIPLDYFDWCLSPKGLTDMDDDLRANINREMKRRAAPSQMELA